MGSALIVTIAIVSKPPSGVNQTDQCNHIVNNDGSGGDLELSGWYGKEKPPGNQTAF
jgi:hypothetical protein